MPFHGRAQIADWQRLADDGAFVDLAAALMQHHYDPRYLKSRGAPGAATVHDLTVNDLTPDALNRTADTLAAKLSDLIPPPNIFVP